MLLTSSITSCVTRVKDKAEIKRIKEQIRRTKLKLNRFKSFSLDATPNSVIKAKDFIKLMNEREKLFDRLEELEDADTAFRIDISGKDGIPQGIESFYIQQGPYTAENFRMQAVKGSSEILRASVRVHRSPNRTIYVHSTNVYAKFIITIFPNGTAEIYP